MSKVPVITRLFQRGAGSPDVSFDWQEFERKCQAYERMLDSSHVSIIYVGVNAEPGNRLAEIADGNGDTPTMRALRDKFTDDEVQPVAVTRWGSNPGSASALNAVIAALPEGSSDGHGYICSPELEFRDDLLRLAISHGTRPDSTSKPMDVVGLYRQGWFERVQWQVPQHTGALVYLPSLRKVGGIAERCNGNGETISMHIGELKEEIAVPIAGMEDFYTQLKMMRDIRDFSWGMVGEDNPLSWETNFTDPKRQREHLIKVARQETVMKIWAKELFPDLPWEEVLRRFMNHQTIPHGVVATRF